MIMQIGEKQEIDSGKVIEISKHYDGVEIIIQEPGSDFELGFAVYYDEYSIKFYKAGSRPVIHVGDDIKIVGHDDPEGIRKLSVNDEVWFDYTKAQARIVRQIRKRLREVAELQEKLDGRAG